MIFYSSEKIYGHKRSWLHNIINIYLDPYPNDCYISIQLQVSES